MLVTASNVIAVFLMTILAASGAAKLASRASFRQTMEGLGLSPALAGFGVWAVPLAELLLAGLLLFDRTQVIAEVGIYGLILAFSWSVYRALSKKLTLSCNCFGDFVPEKFGWTTLFHIGVLAFLNTFLLMMQSTGLLAAPWQEWVAAVLSAGGCLMLYALGMTFMEYRKAWKLNG